MGWSDAERRQRKRVRKNTEAKQRKLWRGVYKNRPHDVPEIVIDHPVSRDRIVWRSKLEEQQRAAMKRLRGE